MKYRILMLMTVLFAAAAVPIYAEVDGNDHSRELVVLVHGFGRTGYNMGFLKNYFVEQGYAVWAPTLPTAFRSVDACAGILAKKLADRDSIEAYERVHFVGHSMGGLIIRRYLADHDLPNMGKCVLIGSPNGGTPLGAIARKWLPPLTWISPAYQSFQPGGVPITHPMHNPPPDFGAIAGDGGGLLLGRLIDTVNDGRVPVDSVPFPGMTAFILLHYHHDEIHHKKETADLIARFLETGLF
jgi:pimeloyl-ACP methyl ester carboxylesterase